MRNFDKIRSVIVLLIVLSFFSVSNANSQSKDEIINGSYFVAFGRFANSGELNYWRKAGNYSIPQLVDLHRNYLASDKNEKSATIHRAFMDAYGWNPNSNDLNYWSAQNKTYSEILGTNLDILRNNIKSRTTVIQQSYYRSFNKLPDDAQLRYWLNQPVYTFAQLVAFHSTWKNQGKSTSSVTAINGNLKQNGISTFSFSQQAIAGVVAAGGANVVPAGGGNVVSAGGMNVVAAGGLN